MRRLVAEPKPRTSLCRCILRRRHSVVRNIAIASSSALFISAVEAAAQPGGTISSSPQLAVSLRGTVRDMKGDPVGLVHITAVGTRASTIADDSGSFRLEGITPGLTTLSVRRIGFAPLIADLQLPAGSDVALAIVMSAVPLRLSPVDVDASPAPRERYFTSTGFFERQAKARGRFITPDEVERAQPRAISDLLYAVPEVRIIGRPRSAGTRFMSLHNGGCHMNIFLDGYLLADAGDDAVLGSDIKAVEIYSSPADAPTRFLRLGPKGICGSIVVWTK